MLPLHRGPSRPACVEMLESRRLLSISPASTAPEPLARAAAVHAPPDLAGAAYTGTANATNGTVYTLTLSIASEKKGGGVTGSLTAVSGGQTLTFAVKGSVSRKGTFTLHGKASNHRGVTLSGTASADANTLSGRFTSSGGKRAPKGTFSVSRV